MRGHRAAGALFGALLLAVSAFAQAAFFDDEEARKQIAAERNRITELQKQIDGRLGRLEEQLKGQGLLDLQSQLQQTRDDMAKLRGQLEVLNNTIENTAKRQRDMYIDLDTRLRRFEGGAPPAAGAPPPPAAATAPPPPPPVAPPAAAAATAAATTAPPPATPAAAAAAAAPTQVTLDPNESRAYESAQSQRRIGNYQGAIFAFQNFLKQYPRSTLAPRAQYWIGDSHFNLRDYRNAIAAQQTLVKTWPDSPSVPDALLNMASSQSELGDVAVARRTMEEIVAKYPASDAAEKAKRRLAAK